MKKFIISEEERSRILSLHEGFKKGLLSEQSVKVSGPYKCINPDDCVDNGFYGKDIYIVKLNKTACRYEKQGNMNYMEWFPVSGDTCGEGLTSYSGGKFYVASSWGNNGIGIPEENTLLSTNGGNGYDTEEEAKKAVSQILNPKGKTGRQVQKGTAKDGTKYKQVTKYDQQGDVQKSKLNLTSSTGNKTVEKTKSGL
jgi:hypothetical protein